MTFIKLREFFMLHVECNLNESKQRNIWIVSWLSRFSQRISFSIYPLHSLLDLCDRALFREKFIIPENFIVTLYE